jgi:serine/threonine protein kinase/WD40 repeat protein
MHKATGNERETPSPPPVAADVGRNDDDGSAIVPPPVSSSGTNHQPATPPNVHRSGDPTRSATPTASPELQPVACTPLRLPERYQILGEHGRGGIGRVSRAYDRELGRDVAIKELISRGRLAEARFLREALITARLEHPGVVPVHEAGRWPDGTPFYAMKLVSGRPLRDLIAESTTVDQRIGLLHHVIAVADAIAYAHRRNIIHRDLKPANVIVGDFGETIVIDWGLAKDLSAADEPTVEGSPAYHCHDRDLTVAGAVLGTPTYMAPEQERGEQVDLRADVFAIGAMLWELCSVHKVPPTNLRQRHRILRRAGVDKDLVVILDKALEPHPMHRYPDAGALAADLKAFKSGARIGARNYSLLDLLSHWTRRHRTLAVSAITAVGLAATATTVYIQNITKERDRANVMEERAIRSQASVETSLEELTLKHAQLLLTTDPSAAVDALVKYRGTDLNRANQIRAEANGRGVALLRAAPHSENVRWAAGTPDGSLISLSIDGTIARTSLDGTSTILARDVARIGQYAYSPSRHLLAYICDPDDLCIYDILHNTRVPIPATLRDTEVVGVSFCSVGSHLALMQREGVLKVFDITTPSHPRQRLSKGVKDGNDVKFVTDQVVVAGTMTSIEFIHMNGNSQSFALPDNSYWDSDSSKYRFTVATIRGQALVFEGFPFRIVARADLCHGPVVGLQFIPGRESIAYGCRDGAIGVWDFLQGKAIPQVQVEGYADLIAVSPAGDYIAAGGNGTVTLLDLNTRLIASYKGHEFRLTTIAPPTREHPFLISADARGAVRVWQLPARFARIAVTLNSPFHTAIFDDRSNRVIATTYLPTLTTFSSDTGLRDLGPHEVANIYLVRSRSGRTFATYGLHDVVELWSSASLTRMRVIQSKQGSISQLSYVGDTDDVVTSGRDGRLVHWGLNGNERLIARLDQPIGVFAIAAATDSVVFSSADGALWYTGDHSQTLQLKKPGSRVNRLLTLPDRRVALGGYANGDVVSIDTQSLQQRIILRASGAVQEISTTPDGSIIAVATTDGIIHIGTRETHQSHVETMKWSALAMRARYQALSSDGLLIVLCTDGTIWMYSVPDRHWLCLPTGRADLRRVVISADGGTAVAIDSEGRLIWIDLVAARKLLDVTH